MTKEASPQKYVEEEKSKKKAQIEKMADFELEEYIKHENDPSLKAHARLVLGKRRKDEKFFTDQQAGLLLIFTGVMAFEALLNIAKILGIIHD